MKKIIYTFVVSLLILLCSCSKNSDEKLVGKWIDDFTGKVVEYTDDGFYYEYVNENFTYDNTRYKTDGKEILYYIEDSKESEYSLEYEIKEGKLIIADSITYTKLGEHKADEK